MKCERCGKETNRSFTFNHVTYCENCARLLGYGRFIKDPSDLLANPFASLNEIASSLMQMTEIDFGNSSLTCPKCGMTLREYETNGCVGCIECYNTFNDYIIREMFKQQGNSEYAGRLPARSSDAFAGIEKTNTGNGADISGPSEEKKDKAASTEKKPDEALAAKNKGAISLEKLKKADLGMLSDEDLEKGIKLAVEAEEYMLASKLRDELKSRKEGEGNG